MTISEDALLAPYAALLSPLAEDAPCGQNLEYDPQYMELFIKIIPKEKKIIGGQSGSERLESEFEPVRWAEVERDCLKLLGRTRDLRLLHVFLRCRIQLAQAMGLLEGLTLLRRLLRDYPEDIHPQFFVEGEYDPLLRCDALAALVDQEGILSDIRGLSVTGMAGLRLEVRDVERSLAVPHPEDAPQPDVVQRQLEDLHARNDPVYLALLQALECARDIERLTRQHFEDMAVAPEVDSTSRQLFQDNIPQLTDLISLLDRLIPRSLPPQEHSTDESIPDAGTGAPHGAESVLTVAGDILSQGQLPTAPGAAQSLPPPTSRRGITDRQTAREQIREVRLWFEQNEPSSPIPLLLRQAEQLVGKRFAEIAQFLPPDLLEKWDAEQ